FLEHVRRHTGKRLLVIWDGSPIHRWGAVREYLSSGAAKWVHVEALPGYAPDLSPWDQGGWHHLKHVEMRNLSCMDLEELHLELHLAIGRLRVCPIRGAQLLKMGYANPTIPQRPDRRTVEARRTPYPGLPRRPPPLHRHARRAQRHPVCAAHRLPVALPPQGLSAQEHRVGLLR